MRSRLPFSVVGLSATTTLSAHSESARPFQNTTGRYALLTTASALTSVHPAPTDTCPGTDVVSTPARARSWQVAHDIASGWHFGVRAGGDARLIASFSVGTPENALSKKNAWPSASAAESPRYSFDGSGGGGPGLASAATRAHSPAFQSHPSDSQNRSSASLPQPVSASRSSQRGGFEVAGIDLGQCKKQEQ